MSRVSQSDTYPSNPWNKNLLFSFLSLFLFWTGQNQVDWIESAIDVEKNSIGMLTIPETFVADIIIREIKGMLARIPRYLKGGAGWAS